MTEERRGAYFHGTKNAISAPTMTLTELLMSNRVGEVSPESAIMLLGRWAEGVRFLIDTFIRHPKNQPHPRTDHES
jgi:hypothetical protein